MSTNKNTELLPLQLRYYHGVSKFKSIRRALRRGHLAMDGTIYPKRPFNNRKDKSFEDIKRIIYNNIKVYKALANQK